MGKDDEQEIITEEDSDLVTDTNAGDDATQGTVAEADVKDSGGQKAPEREK